MKDNPTIFTFNRGLVSELALARLDLSRIAFSAEEQKNYIPRVLGPMTFRPGFGYQGVCDGDGALVPFVYGANDTAILELTPNKMRVWTSGTTLLARDGVTATVANDDFATDLASWTDADESGAVSQWVSPGYMELLGAGYTSARRRQTITPQAGEENDVHSIRVTVVQGPVVLRIGSTAGDDDIFSQAVLRTGTHSIAFTPGGDFTLEFSSSLRHPVWVSEVSMESSGTVELPTLWTSAVICREMDYEQSNDVIFCAHPSVRQQRIERRDNNSWSVCDYSSNDGPFLTENLENVTITPDAINGDVTLTASAPIFKSSNVGSLFRLSSQGQLVQSTLSSAPAFTDSIRVVGVSANSGRTFTVTITGTWVGTLTLQRSIGTEGSWVDVGTYSSNTTVNYSDTYDNTTVYYRIGFKSGDYTSDSAVVSLEYSTGSITGTVLVTGYTSNTEVTGIVKNALGGTGATEFWAEGSWSDKNGWPSAVALWQGRLWWFDRNGSYGSVSDAYSSFDQDIEGDSAPVVKGFGVRSSQNPHWAMGANRLIVGTDVAEYSIRSSAFGEVVSQGNYNVGHASREGSFNVLATMIKNSVVFVDSSGQSVYELALSQDSEDVEPKQLNVLIPELLAQGVRRLSTQRKPDHRLWVVRSDGTCALLVRDPVEDVLAWVEIETDGTIEDVVCLPVRGQLEDDVFIRVKRTVNGSDVRYLEKMALFSQCVGGNLNLMADSFVTGTGNVDGLSHLEGETVVIWADGAVQDSGVVSGGAVSGASYTNWVAGLSYEGRFKSAKMAEQPGVGVLLHAHTRVDHIGLSLVNTHVLGIQYGPDFEVMDNLPLVEDGEVVTDTIYASYDKDMIEFPGDWTNDSRICLKSVAPHPCTVKAIPVKLNRHA